MPGTSNPSSSRASGPSSLYPRIQPRQSRKADVTPRPNLPTCSIQAVTTSTSPSSTAGGRLVRAIQPAPPVAQQAGPAVARVAPTEAQPPQPLPQRSIAPAPSPTPASSLLVDSSLPSMTSTFGSARNNSGESGNVGSTGTGTVTDPANPNIPRKFLPCSTLSSRLGCLSSEH